MYLKHCIASGRPLPQHTWILDSIPGTYNKSLDAMQKHDSSVTYVLESVRRLYAMPTDVFRCKDSVVQALLSRDISMGMVQWIATNLVPVEDGHEKAKRVRFSFDINTIVDLFDDFCGLDMWDFVHDFARMESQQPATIHFIRAGRNTLWDPSAVAALKTLSAESSATSTYVSSPSSSASRTSPTNKVLLHHMEHVGHWLHAEDLHGLLAIIARHSSLQ